MALHWPAQMLSPSRLISTLFWNVFEPLELNSLSCSFYKIPEILLGLNQCSPILLCFMKSNAAVFAAWTVVVQNCIGCLGTKGVVVWLSTMVSPSSSAAVKMGLPPSKAALCFPFPASFFQPLHCLLPL